MNKPQVYTVALSEKTAFNDKYVLYDFELIEPNKLVFQAGQYLSFQVNDQGARRSYSFCSDPAVSHKFEVLIDVSPQGLGCRFFSALEPGDRVQALGPMGRFVIDQDQSRQQEPSLSFIATGSGITPIKAMILDQLHNHQDKREMTLYWGLRHAHELFWQDEFLELSKSFSNFHFHPVISKAVDGWSLCRGRVTDCLSIHELDNRAGFYICGNGQMIQDVEALLLQKQVPPANIHYEKFF